MRPEPNLSAAACAVVRKRQRLNSLAGLQNVTPPLALPAVGHLQSVIVCNVVEIGETTSRCRPASGFVGCRPTRYRDGSHAMGMSPAQMLWKVECPLALPVIVAGLRLAAVTVIKRRS